MEIRLAENIKNYRKQKGLTQEQLAEVMGVSVGAVHKWEAGLSVPELNLIVRLADFFDASVDVLLGYQMKDNRHDAMARRLDDYYNNKDRKGIDEAEKALKKYPNSFQIVFACACIYLGFGAEEGNREFLLKALELLDRSEHLMAQNNDPELSEFVLRGSKGIIYLRLGDVDQALKVFTENNAGGYYNDLIGILYSFFMNRPEEGAPYLSNALLQGISAFMNCTLGYVKLYVGRRDFASANDFLDWIETLIKGLQREKESSNLGYPDAAGGSLQACRAYVFFSDGKVESAVKCLKNALAITSTFDENPNYDVSTYRFMEMNGKIGFFNVFGTTAKESLSQMIEKIQDPGFTKLWKDIKHEEESNKDQRRITDELLS
ncbi:MAG: helix-turn-helix transcriptional regulator [Lachnospiraceae bacterium]|nr:helix-turn-helix transcriptional regulator [Lachnospiraceae bacterium]